MKVDLCLILLLALASCSSTRSMPVVQRSDTTSYVQRSATHDTIYLRDSVYVREVLKGDTIYLTRTQYRDRWRTQIVHDTVLKTDSIVEVIEHPPERYVPPFYKRCTWALWIIVALAIGYGLLRRYIPRL